MRKDGVFCFTIPSLILEIFKILVCKLEIDNIINAYGMETNHKMNIISGKLKAKMLPWQHHSIRYCMPFLMYIAGAKFKSMPKKTHCFSFR